MHSVAPTAKMPASCSLWIEIPQMCAGYVDHMAGRTHEHNGPKGGGTKNKKKPSEHNKPSATQAKHVQFPADHNKRQSSIATRTGHNILVKQISACIKMLPPSEEIDATPQDILHQAELIEESSCNKLQTAVYVYNRLAERYQRQSPDHNTECLPKSSHEETLKQIWIASFTGANIYYRM